MEKCAGIIISSENFRYKEELVDQLESMSFRIKVYIMDYVDGHGITEQEKKLIEKEMVNASSKLKDCSIIIYARSYGAFYEKNFEYIRSFFNVPVIFSTESIIKKIKYYGNSIYVITPYWQERHDLEIKWLKHFKIKTISSMSLGRDMEFLKTVKPEDLRDAVSIASKSENIDCIYIACTFMPDVSGRKIIESVAHKPVISANQSIIEEVKKCTKLE